MEHVVAEHGVSERFACRVLGQHRSTQRKIPRKPDDEAALTADITALAIQYGRYGYRRIAAMLGDQGWVVNVKRVERIWRREGLKVPARQPKRGRLWFNDGSCIRLRPEHPNHVWSYDFVEGACHVCGFYLSMAPSDCGAASAFSTPCNDAEPAEIASQAPILA